MKYRHILAIDPSGNFKEGYGTTGWVLIDSKCKLIDRGYIKASEYKCAEEYWNAHLNLIKAYNKRFKSLIVVIEEYRLYKERALNQTNSLMETPRVIGLMQWLCWTLNQPYTTQLASAVKQRWSDGILYQEKYLKKRKNMIYHVNSGLSMKSDHVRDAFRHALHYAITRNEPRKKSNNNTKGAYNHVRSNYESRPRKTKTKSGSYRNTKKYSKSKRVR